jgi:hypothetical protein
MQNSTNPDEIDPWATDDGFLHYFNTKDRLRPGHTVGFWDMDSPGTGLVGGGLMINGRRFPIGDASWPQLPDVTHGDNGAMFFAPSGSSIRSRPGRRGRGQQPC